MGRNIIMTKASPFERKKIGGHFFPRHPFCRSDRNLSRYVSFGTPRSNDGPRKAGKGRVQNWLLGGSSLED